MSDLQLKIGSDLYGGWTKIDVHRSLDQVADSFDLELTDRWAESMPRRPVRMGSACQVLIDGEVVVTGYVDESRPHYDKETHTVSASGRSKTADLVDCSAPVRLYGQTLEAVAKEICKPFGISVVSEVETSPIQIAQEEQGQTAYEVLESLSRQAAVILTSNANGDLVITRASDKRVSTALVLGENAEIAEGTFSMRDRFSEYIVKAQNTGGDMSFGEEAAHIKETATDALMRYRPTVIIAEDPSTPADAKRRAEWQRNVNYGRSRQATYTVNGWRHKDGLWIPNRQVRVKDELLGFNDEWLMIAGVRYVLDERGERVELTVMPKEAFDLIPIPAETEGW